LCTDTLSVHEAGFIFGPFILVASRP